MILAIRPELVRADQLRDDGEGLPQGRLSALRQAGIETAIWWYADHPTHYRGDGLPATAEKGERLLAARGRALAAAIRHSLLLGEFVRTVYGPALQRLDTQLSPLAWDSFLADCAQHDPAVAHWAASTRAKLYEVVIRILAEAKYLASTRQPTLTPPMLHPVVRQQLMRLGAQDTLHLMDFHR